ncbi:electron transfer flavoprotein subunit beta/FixA family protein [Microbacterium pygmaeum]|uniref:Electron transfer flavoprotein subunit beta n=1 Tax=Microbacterium pygmaeum TaxID=370764 RepID=A0A1G7XKW2_9MICO|nr:electron transfer flavoprotein subunit beta/FixA family protein [Microbacterium pygmaeum]SDG84716.1 electron transfer flavoprotein beta subunit [Microbacterium pygmaeum]
MKIVVLMKEVPDTYGDRKLDVATGLADRAASEAVPDEINERALEVALHYADQNDAVEVTLLSMAPADATATIRKGLAMGAHSAVHVVDDALRGADMGLTALVLSTAITQRGFDLVIAGNRSTDGASGMLPAMIAERLDVPSLTSLNDVEIGAAQITGQRSSDGATLVVTAALPAVISVTESLPDARFPNFKGIMAAKKKPIETVTIESLTLSSDEHTTPRSIVIAAREKPARTAGIKVVDTGDAGRQLADFLVQNRLV